MVLEKAMYKLICTFVTVLFLSSISVRAQDYKVGIGARFTNAQATVNNAISLRYFVNNHNAFEGLVSFDPFTIGLLYELFQPLGGSRLNWFIGGGGYVSLNNNDNVLGATGIIGLDYSFKNAPINISLDWKPELNLIEDVNFEAAAVGLGIRFILR